MSFTFTSSIETSISIHDAADFLNITLPPTAIDRDITVRVNLNQLFSLTMLAFNYRHPVHGYTRVDVPPDYHATVYNFWQAFKSTRFDQDVGWSALHNGSGLSLQDVVSEQLIHLFSTLGETDLEAVGLTLNPDSVKAWIDSSAPGTFGAEVFNSLQLSELLEMCSDANLFIETNQSRMDARDPTVTTTVTYRALQMHPGDQLVVKIRVVQDETNTALWLLRLEQSEEPLSTSMTLDPYSGQTWDILTLPAGTYDAFYREVTVGTEESVGSTLTVVYGDATDTGTELEVVYDSTSTELEIIY